MTRRVLFVAIAAAAVLPLAVLLVVSLAETWFWPALVPPALDFGAWEGVVSGDAVGRRLGRAMVNSVLIATVTGVLAAGCAVAVGRPIARLSGWRRHVGAAAAFLPVAAPPLAVAIGLQYTFLRLGLAGQTGGVILAHLVPAVGYTSLFFIGVFTLFDDSPEEEARTLGATRWQTLTRITLPLLRRPLVEAFVLGFLVSWAQVPLTLIVGQGLVPTLAVEVLAHVQAGQDRIAATGAILLIVPPLLTMAAASVAVGRAKVAV